MKRKGTLKESLVTALEVPRDLAYKDPIITITGPSYMVIENYRSILRYTNEEIVILSIRGKISLYGKRLCISCYTPWEMQVTGKIMKVCLDW